VAERCFVRSHVRKGASKPVLGAEKNGRLGRRRRRRRGGRLRRWRRRKT
jgi:hypothetical protein